MVLVSFGIFIIVAVVLTRQMDSVPLLNRLLLAPPDAEAAKSSANPTGGSGPAVGDAGVAHTPLRPGGKARFGERVIAVLTRGDFLNRGTPIRVVRVTGNQVLVEAAEEQ